jgi:hypothetical protein
VNKIDPLRDGAINDSAEIKIMDAVYFIKPLLNDGTISSGLSYRTKALRGKLLLQSFKK